MYSDMSSWISASSSPNRNSASAFESSVFPTPDGPRKMNEPVGRRGHAADPHPAAGLVDQVDRLVREEPVGDVAVGEVGGRHDRLVRVGDPVVRLVAVAETLQDLDRVDHGRLGDLDGLEAPFE